MGEDAGIRASTEFVGMRAIVSVEVVLEFFASLHAAYALLTNYVDVKTTGCEADAIGCLTDARKRYCRGLQWREQYDASLGKMLAQEQAIVAH